MCTVALKRKINDSWQGLPESHDPACIAPLHRAMAKAITSALVGMGKNNKGDPFPDVAFTIFLFDVNFWWKEESW